MVKGIAGCAAVVAALAIAFPLTLGGTSRQPVSAGLRQQAVAGTGSWGSKLTCGGRVPDPLPGPEGGGIRLTIRAISRSASGGVQASPYTVSTLPDNAGPPMGPVDTVQLILHRGVIVAAEKTPEGGGNFMVPAVGLNIPPHSFGGTRLRSLSARPRAGRQCGNTRTTIR